MAKKMVKLEREINKSAIVVGDFNTPPIRNGQIQQAEHQ